MPQISTPKQQDIRAQMLSLQDAIRRKQKFVEDTLTKWGTYPDQHKDQIWLRKARKQLAVLTSALQDSTQQPKPQPLPTIDQGKANQLNASGYNLKDAYRVLQFGASPTDYVRRTDGTSGSRFGAASQFAKILGGKPNDYLKHGSPAQKLVGAYANALDQNQGSLDDELKYLDDQEGVTGWSKFQQEQALKNNPDLAQIGGPEYFGRNLVRGVFHPSAVIREEIGGDRRTADQITQGEKVSNFLTDALLNYALTEGASSAMQGVRGGIAATDGIRGTGALKTAGAFLKGGTRTTIDALRGGFVPVNSVEAKGIYQAGKAALKGLASHAAAIAPDTLVQARQLQNATGSAFLQALGQAAKNTAQQVFTTKYYLPNNDPNFGLGDRVVGIGNQLGLMIGGAKWAHDIYDRANAQLKSNTPSNSPVIGRDALWQHVDGGLNRKGYVKREDLGPVDRNTAEQTFRKTGIDISGRTQFLTAEYIRHIAKKHGNPATEASRGQVAVQPSDFMDIRDVIRNAQQITLLPPNERTGNPQIRYARVNPTGTTFVVVEVMGKKGGVNVNSIYRWKNRKLP